MIRLLISSCVLASMLSSAWGTELLVASGNSVNVREGPALTARVLTQVNKGDTLDRLGSEGEWVHVNIHGDNLDGWIHEDFVREGTSTGTIGSDSDASPIDEVAYQKCIARLVEIHKRGVKVETVDEYIMNRPSPHPLSNVYHLKGNYRVDSPSNHDRVLGFECDYYVNQQKVTVVPFQNTFDKRQSEDDSISGMMEYRLELGGDACPDSNSWKDFTEEMKRGNWNAELAASCVWLERGTRVYGPPLATHTYNGSDFVQVKLVGGQSVWIEPATLE